MSFFDPLAGRLIFCWQFVSWGKPWAALDNLLFFISFLLYKFNEMLCLLEYGRFQYLSGSPLNQYIIRVVEHQQLYLIMIGSHFFPKNCVTRRALVLRDRPSSLGIHSQALSKENSKQLKSLDKSETISLHELPQKQKSFNLKLDLKQRRQAKLSKKEPDQKQQSRFNPRKKTLYVKGFCKKPSFEIKINAFQQQETREAITSNCRRIRRDISDRNKRLGTSVPLDPNGKQFKLTKRKSKDTCVFRGWEINYDDFTDF